MRYMINAPRIAHETIDGETVLIDFDSGAYFSTSGTGALMLDGLLKGLDRDEVMASLTGCLAGDPAVMRGALDDFIRQLETEALIIPSVAESPSPPPCAAVASKVDFSVPLLEKYTDMQDLLLLDPIHEVGEQGWPYKAASA